MVADRVVLPCSLPSTFLSSFLLPSHPLAILEIGPINPDRLGERCERVWGRYQTVFGEF